MNQQVPTIRLIAIGDIHGCYDSFKTIVEEKIKLKKTDKLILLGDYIDRGTQSKEVVDYIIKLQDQNYDVIALLGNHESLLLNAYENPDLLSKWILNGASASLKSFGIDDISKLESKYLDFFKRLKYYFAYEDYLFVHAGFNDDIEDPFSDTYHMLWNCRENYNHKELNKMIIVHGHCPDATSSCDQAIINGGKIINIDTGCVYKDQYGFGRLTAVDLNYKIIHFA